MVLFNPSMTPDNIDIHKKIDAIFGSHDSTAIALLHVEVDAIFHHLLDEVDPGKNQHSQSLL